MMVNCLDTYGYTVFWSGEIPKLATPKFWTRLVKAYKAMIQKYMGPHAIYFPCKG